MFCPYIPGVSFLPLRTFRDDHLQVAHFAGSRRCAPLECSWRGGGSGARDGCRGPTAGVRQECRGSSAGHGRCAHGGGVDGGRERNHMSRPGMRTPRWKGGAQGYPVPEERCMLPTPHQSPGPGPHPRSSVPELRRRASRTARQVPCVPTCKTRSGIRTTLPRQRAQLPGQSQPLGHVPVSITPSCSGARPRGGGAEASNPAPGRQPCGCISHVLVIQGEQDQGHPAPARARRHDRPRRPPSQ
jgi:hypothetical protein